MFFEGKEKSLFSARPVWLPAVISIAGPLLFVVWGLSRNHLYLVLAILFTAYFAFWACRLAGITLIVVGAVYLQNFHFDGWYLQPWHLVTGLGVVVVGGWLLSVKHRVRLPSIAILLMVLLILQATPGYGSLEDTLFSLGRTVSLLALAVALDSRNDSENLPSLGALTTMLSLPVALLMLSPFAHFLSLDIRISEGERWGGLIGHPNLAAVTIVILMIGFSSIVHKKSDLVPPWIALLSVAVLIFGPLAVLLTGSLSGIGLLVLFALFGAFVFGGRDLLCSVRRGEIQNRSLRFLLIFFPLLVVAGDLIWGRSVLTARLSRDYENVTSATSPTINLLPSAVEGNLRWRFDAWGRILDVVGPGEPLGLGAKQSQKLDGIEHGAHSGFVELYVEFGWLGLALMIMTIMILVVHGLVKRNHKPEVILVMVLITIGSVTEPALMSASVWTAVLFANYLANVEPPDRRILVAKAT